MLQIASDRSRPGESRVVLRLSRSAHAPATVSVSTVANCAPLATVASARLAPGGKLALHLTVQRGAGPGFFVAQVRAGSATRSVELVVPAEPEVRLLG